MTSPTLTRRTRQFPKQEPPAHLYTDFFEALDGIDGPPVWVVNDIDSEPCPPLVFKWIEEYHLGAGIPIRDDHFSHGCTCPGKECDLKVPNECECLDDSEEKKFAYDADGLIHHPPGTAIFECNNQCHCGRTCPNRVVQRGRRMPVEIFKTQKKGWGMSP
jgi:histone-lysine N-methyltransferase SUV39H